MASSSLKEILDITSPEQFPPLNTATAITIYRSPKSRHEEARLKKTSRNSTFGTTSIHTSDEFSSHKHVDKK